MAGLLAFPALSAAQMTRGSLGGTVRDASGGVLPGVSVTVTNADTEVARTVVSDAEGFYRIPALEPGRTRSRPSSAASDRRAQGPRRC